MDEPLRMDPTTTELPDGLKLGTTLSGHSSTIHQISWSPKDDILVSPSFDKTTRLWKNGERIQMLKDSVGRFIAAAWSPQGNHLALASDNDMLRLWDVEKGESERTRTGGLGYITCLAWDPAGQHVATGALNGSLRLWDSEFKNFTPLIKKGSDEIFCLTFCANTALLAVGFKSGIIRLWDMRELKESEPIQAHSGPVYSLAFSRKDSAIISAGADATIRIFSGPNRKETILKGHKAAVISISISADNAILASKSFDQTVRLWSMEIFEQLALIPEINGKSWLAGLAFHNQKPMLATLGDEDKTLRIWDVDAKLLTGG